MMSSMEAFIWSLLGYAVYPAWLLTGMVDFRTHRAFSCNDEYPFLHT